MFRKQTVIMCVSAFFLFLTPFLNAAPPVAPSKLEHTGNTTNSITWVWQDNSSDEQGFRCYSWYWDNTLGRYIRSTNPVWSVNANITSYIETGLAPNTLYKRVIVAWNEDGENPRAIYDSSRGHYYYRPFDYGDNFAEFYTSIQPPAGLEFGPKGMDALTVRLTEPVPSNLSSGSSGFCFEELTTFQTSIWHTDNNDFDPLGTLSGPSLSAISWQRYLKNGTATYNPSNGTYTSEHKWKYYCFDNLQPNTPYKFRAKARNGDGDETAWCSTSQEIWTLPLEPAVRCDKQLDTCYDPGTKFTFTSLIPFGIGTVDHYHIMWTTNPLANPSEASTKWFAGDWVITENRTGDFFLVIKSHNFENEEPVTYEKPRDYFPIDGTVNLAFTFVTDALTGEKYTYQSIRERNQHIVTVGPFKIGYDVKGKVTISGGTGSYTDVVVHCGGYTTKCNSSGLFEFKNLLPGTYDIYAELPGYRIAYPIENGGRYSVKLPDPADAPRYIKTGIDFTLAYKNTYTIAGKVSFVGGPGGMPSNVTATEIRCGSYGPVYPDSKGNFYVPGVFAGTYKLRASVPTSDPDYANYEITFPSGGEYTVSVGPDATGKDFVFTWTEGIDTASISGNIKLIGGSGDPSRAIVYCKNLNTGIEGTTSPDNKGAYNFPSLPKGNSYEIWVKMAGYRTSLPASGKITITNLQDDQSGQDFELIPISYYRVSGRLDIAEGIIKPPDTKLHLDCTSDTSISFTLHPENDGTFVFSSVPEGTYNLYPEIPAGYKVANPFSGKYTGIVVGPDAIAKNFLVEAIAKYSFSGKITLQGGTCRPNEALVVCQYYNTVKKEYITFSTIPDSSGVYKFVNLVPASYTVYVMLAGYTTLYPTSGTHTVTITNKDISGKDFYLASYAIKGKVSFITPSVEPVTNVILICSAISKNPDVPSVYKVTHPDSSGNYAFYNLQPSSKLADPNNRIPVPYRVEVFLAGHGSISPSTGYYDVTITNKDEQKDFILGVYSVSGKLTLYSGKADLTQATVTAARLDHQGGNEIEWMVTNPKSDGSYQITGLKPRSYYRIRVKLPDFYSLVPKERQGLNWGYEIYVPPSATNKDFILYPATVPSNPTCTISGKITIPYPITPDRVIVHCGDLTTYPDRFGYYYFKNLNPGTYDVWAERKGYHTTFPTTNAGHYYIVLNESNSVESGLNFVLDADPVPVYKISGTVTLVGGSGDVKNVIVHCNNLTANPNSAGQYSFTNLPEGSYELWVELPKYQTTNPGGSGKQTVKLYDRDVAGVDFTMQAIPTYSIKGTVTISDGDVTKVKIACSSGVVVNPDAFGRYVISELLAGSYQVYAEMPGYIVTSPKNNVYNVKLGPDAQNCDFTLTKTYSISGTVTLNGGTGNISNVTVRCGEKVVKPLLGVMVYVAWNSYNDPTENKKNYKYHYSDQCPYVKNLNPVAIPLEEAQRDYGGLCSFCAQKYPPPDNGGFEFTGLLPGDYEVYATLDGYAATNPSSGTYKITVGPDATLKNFTLTATILLSVSGKVNILNGSASVTDVVISSAGLTTHPDENGNYTLSGLSPGSYELTAALGDYTTVAPAGGKYAITLRNSNLTNYNFSLATYSISGNVKISHGNVQDVEIRCDDGETVRTTHPDENGNYIFPRLPAGNYRLTSFLPYFSTIFPGGDGSYTIQLGPSATNRNFTLIAYSISGKVSFYETTGRIQDVSIRCTGPGIDITVHPDEKGFYKIAPLPAGDYEIIATLPGYTVVSPIGGRYAFTVKSDLTDKNFVISSFSISGRVSLINSPGKVENVTVTLTGSSGTINTSPDEKGYYKFSILPAGSYSITASFENHTTVFPYAGSYNIKIPQSATGKDFKLVAYSISGTVRVNDISGPAGTIVYCEGPSGTLQYNVGNDGKFSFYPLPAGDYSLRAEKSGFKTVYPSEEVYQFKLGSFATKNFVLKRR